MIPKLLLSLALALTGLPMTASAVESVPYKGRIIQVGDSPAAKQCVEMARKAIDMVEGLPSHLKMLGHAVKDLKCDPPRESGAYLDNVIGVYTMTSKTEPRGYIDFRTNPAFRSPAQFAISIVNNGIYAGWHRSYIQASHQAAADPAAREKARQLEALLSKGDLGAVARAECDFLAVTRETIQALDLGERQISAIGKSMRNRNCL
ncbi:conserved exported hypothetical protein [Candidatus Terasakiella magnetica]|nr:conserved exported hypothetical protein [Candidatus Terasakiella magnetica]